MTHIRTVFACEIQHLVPVTLPARKTRRSPEKIFQIDQSGGYRKRQMRTIMERWWLGDDPSRNYRFVYLFPKVIAKGSRLKTTQQTPWRVIHLCTHKLSTMPATVGVQEMHVELFGC